MTFAEYRALVDTTQTAHPEWRSGQTAVNVLRDVRPDLAEGVRGRTTDLDPFVIDDNLDRFYTFVQASWGAS